MLNKGSLITALCLVASTAAAQDAVDLTALRAETRQLEQHMYDVFNSLNSDDEFDVTCGEKKVTGSAIPAWTCEAAFMRNAAARGMSSRFDNPGAAMANTQGGFIPQSTRQVAFNERKKTQELNEEMMALARQHEELASAMIAFNAKREQLDAADK
jgi:hypothetical protein